MNSEDILALLLCPKRVSIQPAGSTACLVERKWVPRDARRGRIMRRDYTAHHQSRLERVELEELFLVDREHIPVRRRDKQQHIPQQQRHRRRRHGILIGRVLGGGRKCERVRPRTPRVRGVTRADTAVGSRQREREEDTRDTNRTDSHPPAYLPSEQK